MESEVIAAFPVYCPVKKTTVVIIVWKSGTKHCSYNHLHDSCDSSKDRLCLV